MRHKSVIILFLFISVAAYTEGLKCMQPSDARLITSSVPLPNRWLHNGRHKGQYLDINDNGHHEDISHERGIRFTPRGVPMWWLQNRDNTAHYMMTHIPGRQSQLLCANTDGGLQVHWFRNTAENQEQLWCQWIIEMKPDDVNLFRVKSAIFQEPMDHVQYLYVDSTGVYFDYDENSRNDVRNVVPDERKWFRWVKLRPSQRDFSAIEDVCHLGESGLPDFLETGAAGISVRSARKRNAKYFVSKNNLATCGPSWFLYKNKCYRIFRYLSTWRQRAVTICNFFKAKLTVPKNQGEQTFLVRLLGSYDKKGRYWLGMKRRETGSRYYDLDNQRLQFRRWGRSLRANFASEKCSYWHKRRWFRTKCEDQHKLLCVREATLTNNKVCGKIQVKGVDQMMESQAFPQESRIINGIPAEDGQFPWQVSIRFPQPIRQNGIDVIHNCGGTLIDSCWVLTASHCVHETTPEMFRVRLGDLNNVLPEASEQEFEIERIIWHEDYSLVPSPRNDIALIKLRPKNGKCARFTDAVQPACLPDDTFPFPDDSRCQVSGWGATNFTLGQRSASKILEWATLPKLPDRYCRSRYNRNFEAFVDNLMFCAGLKKGGTDACTGDSGGPYACRNKAGKYAVSGIVSFGIGCARARYPGVYTNVRNYLPWIAAKIAANGGGEVIQTA